MRIALVLSLAALAAGCARQPEPEPVVFPEPAPVVTSEPVFTGKI